MSLPCLPAVAGAKSNGLRSTDRCSHVAVRRPGITTLSEETNSQLLVRRSPRPRGVGGNIGFDSWRRLLYVNHV